MKTKNSTALEIKMKSEINRLASFKTWPLKQRPGLPTGETLAASGFYYLNKSLSVSCPFCGLVIFMWFENEDPLERHRQHCPNCAFIKKVDKGKTNLRKTTAKVTKRRPFSGPERKSSAKKLKLQLSTGAKKCIRPYLTFRDRKRSFVSKAIVITPNPDELADAGFYYTGPDDTVKCFYCGGVLDTWEPTDNPWIEHARLFPFCGFVKKRKGEDFITEAADKKSEVNPQSPSDNSLCKLCYDEERSVVFMPCKHFVCCATCAAKNKLCPMCREVILEKMQVYL